MDTTTNVKVWLLPDRQTDTEKELLHVLLSPNGDIPVVYTEYN